ncbi:MAG: hypothetical protein KDA81_19985, partial [Planctomycetaceae bacterium]|nr:hypothetical protein [Planctomycetaceae bacterium]
MKPAESPKPEPASKSANKKGNEIKLPPALAGISGSETTSEGNNWQRYLSDDKRLAFHAPPGKRTNRTLSLPGVLPWSKLESVEVGQNNGATFVSLIFTFPRFKRRELMNPEEFI